MAPARAKHLLEPPGVIEEISPDDFLFRRGAAEGYFRSAAVALGHVRGALLAAAREQVDSVLDFACGYGRVLRMLKAEFPRARLAAADVNRDAVDFCAGTFGARAVYSRADASDVELGDRFDLIWSGSFFTHIDADAWRDFLVLLSSSLAPGGVMVFTVAGRHVVELMRAGERAQLTEQAAQELISDYERDGFGFAAHPGRERYGFARVTPSWVCTQLEQLGNVRLLSYHESRGAEGERQDFVSCVRLA